MRPIVAPWREKLLPGGYFLNRESYFSGGMWDLRFAGRWPRSDRFVGMLGVLRGPVCRKIPLLLVEPSIGEFHRPEPRRLDDRPRWKIAYVSETLDDFLPFLFKIWQL